MTDNRTTELRGKLDALGIEHLDSDLPNNKQTRWNKGAGGWGACYVEITRSSILPADSIIDNRTLRIYDCTPEQAVAATLGRQKAKSHPYGYERDTGCYDSTRCECGCINDISARYCNDCGGEIEIDESAEKEYYDGYSKHTVFAKKHDDGSLELCERRYVPEDAATLGSEHEAKLIQAMEDVLRHSTDTVWVGEAETLVDRMVSIDVYNQDVYEGTRPWEVD